MKRPNTVDEYIMKHPEWQALLMWLREIALAVGMEEGIKWGAPVYMVKGKNVAGMAAFTSYVSLWFFQGALLNDPHKLLVNAQEGKTKALRQLRFTSPEEIDREIVRAYLEEAARNQREGKAIKPQQGQPLVLPPELKDALGRDAEALRHFEVLPLYKRREYAEYIETAKREETRRNRLERILPMILKNTGLNDKYRNERD